LERAKLDVENHYRAKIGEDPVSGLDSQWAWTPAGRCASARRRRWARAMRARPPTASTQPPTKAPSTPDQEQPEAGENTNRGKTFSVTVGGKVYSFKDRKLHSTNSSAALVCPPVRADAKERQVNAAEPEGSRRDRREPRRRRVAGPSTYDAIAKELGGSVASDVDLPATFPVG
jgi:hypothetical protein